MRALCGWGYAYVENLTWVLVAPNHRILRLPYAKGLARRSHLTLLIFRREGAWAVVAGCLLSGVRVCACARVRVCACLRGCGAARQEAS